MEVQRSTEAQHQSEGDRNATRAPWPDNAGLGWNAAMCSVVLLTICPFWNEIRREEEGRVRGTWLATGVSGSMIVVDGRGSGGADDRDSGAAMISG